MSESAQKHEKSVTLKQRLVHGALFGLLLIPIMMFFTPDRTASVSGAQTDDKNAAQVMSLLAPMTEMTIHSVNIGYGEEVISSGSILSGSQSQAITTGVVVVYSGMLEQEYDLTHAISILLDVPFHQITFIEV